MYESTYVSIKHPILLKKLKFIGFIFSICIMLFNTSSRVTTHLYMEGYNNSEENSPNYLLSPYPINWGNK